MKNKELVRIEFSNRFNKDRQLAPLVIKIALRDAIELFRDDNENEILRSHSLDKLGKRYYGLWSINITDDWRAIYRKKDNRIIFMMLRTHKKLYGS